MSTILPAGSTLKGAAAGTQSASRHSLAQAQPRRKLTTTAASLAVPLVLTRGPELARSLVVDEVLPATGVAGSGDTLEKLNAAIAKLRAPQLEAACEQQWPGEWNEDVRTSGFARSLSLASVAQTEAYGAVGVAPSSPALDAGLRVKEVANGLVAADVVVGLSAELDALMLEVEQDILPFLEQHQHQQLESSADSFRRTAAASASTLASSSSSRATALALPVGLSILDLAPKPLAKAKTVKGRRAAGPVAEAGAGTDVAGVADPGLNTAAAGAGDRAQRRRQNWRREGAAAAASAPPSASHYKTRGNNSVSKFMGGFTKDTLLKADEELQLAAAAQDFMALQDVGSMLAGVLRRQPSMEEIAAVMQCDSDSLHQRLTVGNRARATLAQKNYRLVVSIAKYFCGFNKVSAGSGGSRPESSLTGGGSVAFEDALTAGMEGLMQGIRKYKPESGYRLSTYCTWWIRQHVRKYTRSQAALNVPITMREAMDRVGRVRKQLAAADPLAKAPSDEQVAAELGWPLARVQAAEAARYVVNGARSFETPVDDGDGDSGNLGDRLPTVLEDDDFCEGGGSSLSLDSEEHYVRSSDLNKSVEGVLASLDAQEASVLRGHYGLDPLNPRDGRGRGNGAGEGNDGSAAAEAEAAADAAGAVPAAHSEALAQEFARSQRGRRRPVVASAEAEAPAAEAAESQARAQVPGAQRLQLRPVQSERMRAYRAMQKLRKNLAASPTGGMNSELGEWLSTRSDAIAGPQLPGRSGGYAKKT